MTPSLWAVVALVGVAAAWLVQSLWLQRREASRTHVVNIIVSSAMALIAGATVVASQEQTALRWGAVSLAIGLIASLLVLRARR